MEFFDTPGDFVRETVTRKRQSRGDRGIEYDVNPKLLYCIMMPQKVWILDDGKYVSDESACRFWRNPEILPVTWNVDTKNNVGIATLAHRKKISDDICNELFNQMVQVKVKSHPSTDTYIVSSVFHSSFVADPKC